MKFWKFETPTEEQIESLLNTGGLPPSVTMSGLSNTYEKVVRKLKPGDCVVLASLKGDQSKIVVFGKVQAVGNTSEQTLIKWAKASHGVYPTDSGLEHWRTKTTFEISKEPAERYGLRRFIEFHIKSGS